MAETCELAIPLGMREIQENLSKLNSWSINEAKLEREFKFPDFKSASEFVSQISKLAEELNHHPEIELSWGRVKVSLYTHKINALSNADFSLAEKIDKI